MIKVNGDSMEWRDGMTGQDVLDAKKYKFPLLIVTIGEEHVPKERYSAAEVQDGTDVKVLHMLSGG
jgi:sulfur carrier protein